MTPEKKMGKYSIKSLEIEFLLKYLKKFQNKSVNFYYIFQYSRFKACFSFPFALASHGYNNCQNPGKCIVSIYACIYYIREKYGHFISKP